MERRCFGGLVLVLAFAVAAPVRAGEPGEAAAEALHGGLSAGIGTAYDLAGVRLELGSNHFSGFVGIGLLATYADTLSAPGNFGFSAGARWYRGVRRGFFASLNLTEVWYRDYYS